MAVSEGILLDTHTWLWLDGGRLAASPEVRKALQAAFEADLVFVTAFTMFEIAHKVSRGRLDLGMSLPQWFRAALGPPGPRILELTPQIAAAVLQLPEDFHGDPGDRILAATASVKRLTLFTHDAALLRFGKQGVYKCRKVREEKTQDG